MKFRHNQIRREQPAGFTLIELTFSLAMFTAILTICLIGFIGIFGIYNKAQGLTRTQQEARSGIDQLVKDLRRTTNIRYFAVYNSNDSFNTPSQGVNPASANAAANQQGKDFYCLTSESDPSFQVGYALFWVPERSYYTLARTTNCGDYSLKTFAVSTDVWNDKGINPGAGAATSSAVNSTDFPANARPLRIIKVAPTTSINPGDPTPPAVWQVTLGTFRGQSAPTMPGFTTFNDQFGAGTTLQAIVVTRS